jgi:hypothetical protein
MLQEFTADSRHLTEFLRAAYAVCDKNNDGAKPG